MFKVSVIIVCHRRFENFEEVLQGWLKQEEVDEVIVLDNSGSFKTDLPVIVVNVSQNLGPQGKYPLALWAKNEFVIFADDDILVKPGLVSDFIKHAGKNRIVSMIGRIFDGPDYYSSSGYRGVNIDKPIRVDWVGGGCTLVHRSLCSVNIRDCPDMGIDDLWWEYQIKEKAELYVVPTKNYRILPEGFDMNSLYRKAITKTWREKAFNDWNLKRKHPFTVLRLNIGCGEPKYHLKDYKNIDINPICEPDETYDIRKGIKESNETVDEILISHVLMYFPRNVALKVLIDCLRVLKKGGIIRITEDNRHVKKRNEKQQEQYGEGELFTRLEMAEVLREADFVDIKEAEPFPETDHHVRLPKNYPLAKGEAAVYFIQARKRETTEKAPIVYLSFDDFGERIGNMDLLWRLRDYFDDFKVTMFAIPNECLRESWLEYIKNLGWIVLGLHGYNHLHNENIDEITLKEVTAKYFLKLYKAPFWELSDKMYERLKKLGFRIFLDKGDSRKGIKYNWNIKDSPPSSEIIHGHGHIYPADYKSKSSCPGNALYPCIHNILKLPKNTKFMLY